MLRYILTTFARITITPYIWGLVTVQWLRATYRGEKLNIIIGDGNDKDDTNTPSKLGVLSQSAIVKANGTK